MADLSLSQARRLALSSLGFAEKRPTKTGAAHVRKTIARTNAIQIDSVNVLARAHYVPTFSRYGPYDTKHLDDLAHGKREFFEFWGHAACFLPMELYPYMRWRMDNQRDGWSTLDARSKKFIKAVLDEVTEHGPKSAGELSMAGKSKGSWWGWSDGKRAIEYLFRQGQVAIAGRRNFERLYDIPERVIPADVLKKPVVPAHDAKKELLVRIVRAMGVATARDAAQYFHIDAWWDRSSVQGRRPQKKATYFEELVEEGRLERVNVESWKQPGYVVPGAKIPRAVNARAIVSPFDPLMWERRWTEAVFGFKYQIEIYVPQPKRIYGYYVLPFVLGDRFAARVDLKADRKAKTLLIPGAFVEPGAEPKATAAALADELRDVASWLGLEKIAVATHGDLSSALRSAVRRSV